MSFFAGAAAGAIASQIALHQLHKHSGGAAPSFGIQCGTEGGSSPQWAVVAHTQWGNIPGKFNASGCFYPYAGEEKSTGDFSFISVPSGWRLENNHGSPPAYALKVGFQNDGTGDYWSIVAHTEFGDIPGKARGGEGWYPYCGKEYSTKSFSWLVANPPSLHSFHKHTGGGAPAGAIQCGNEGGNSPQWGIIAHTQWGNIPGKFNSSGCFYPYGGEEKNTSDFSFIVAPRGWHLEKHKHHGHHGQHAGPPQNALKVGFQNDGTGDYWLIVAHTQYGDVPGKARGVEAWYPFCGKEYGTSDFSWVVANF